MSGTKSLMLSVPLELHAKLKIKSIVSGRSMNSMAVECLQASFSNVNPSVLLGFLSSESGIVVEEQNADYPEQRSVGSGGSSGVGSQSLSGSSVGVGDDDGGVVVGGGVAEELPLASDVRGVSGVRGSSDRRVRKGSRAQLCPHRVPVNSFCPQCDG